MELTTNRSKGVNAFLVSVDSEGNLGKDFDFGKPKTERDQEAAYKSKKHVVEIDETEKSNGYYFYRECALDRGVNEGYIKIEDGEIVEEWQTKEEFLRSQLPELPELIGTLKQIRWAESIRADFVKSIGNRLDWTSEAVQIALEKHSHASIWIDNRDKLNPEKFIEKVKDLESELKATEEWIELQDSIQEVEEEFRVTFDDEVLSELEIYAIVYLDRIEVVANVTGAGKVIPKSNRTYIGSVDRWIWEYPLSTQDEIFSCGSIEVILSQSGERLK